MKRKFLALFLTILMICGMIPSVVSAVTVADLPDKWTKPTELALVFNEEDDDTSWRIACSVGEDHSTFFDDIINQENYSKYGLNSIIYSYSKLQVDWRIDDGAWNYDESWDTLSEQREGNDIYLYDDLFGLYGNERSAYADFLSLPHVDDTDTFNILKTALLEQGVAETDISISDKEHMAVDWTKYKLDVRVRVVTVINGDDIDSAYGESGSYHYIISDWSDVISGGKNIEAVKEPTVLPKPIVTNLTVSSASNHGFLPDGYPLFNFNLSVTPEVAKIDASKDALYASFEMDVQVSVNGGEWTKVTVDNGSPDITNGVHVGVMPNLENADYISVLGGDCRLRIKYFWEGDTIVFSEYSDILTFREDNWQGSNWAIPELEKADGLGLIPDVLKSEDLTKNITRAEFAAVVVKVYENLAGTKALPAVVNPFNDCNDVEVLKAYNINAVLGTSDITFEPDEALNREQAATMLTRVFKRVTMPGWTIKTDGNYILNYTKPALFADDKDISSWASDSVYFMASHGIILGMGGNMFAPKNITEEHKAMEYANATRQQALLIAVRMVEKLK